MATKKSERAISFECDAAMRILTFRAATGESFAIDLEALSDDAKRNAVAFGVARKVTNAAALDAGAAVADKWEAVKAVAERLAAGGEWNAPGAGRVAGSGGGASGLVIAALVRVYGGDAAGAEATIVRTMEKKGMDRKAALKLWAGTDKIAGAIAAIQAERAAAKAAGAKVDADDLAAELAGE